MSACRVWSPSLRRSNEGGAILTVTKGIVRVAARSNRCSSLELSVCCCASSLFARTKEPSEGE